MKIIKESIQDIETYLRSKEVKDAVMDLEDDQDACDMVLDIIENHTSDKMQPTMERVFVVSVDQDLTDTIDSDHYVIRYNNYYYDFTADKYNEAFDISKEDIPVIQPVMPEGSLTSNISTIKRYALVKY